MQFKYINLKYKTTSIIRNCGSSSSNYLGSRNVFLSMTQMPKTTVEKKWNIFKTLHHKVRHKQILKAEVKLEKEFVPCNTDTGKCPKYIKSSLKNKTKHQVLTSRWNNMNFLSLLVEIQNSTLSLEDSLFQS